MAIHKLVLDEDFREDFSLLAIHCSEESYKMAYSLNQHLGLRLHRMRTDVHLSKDGADAQFPIFEFLDELQYTTYYLVSNKSKTKVVQPNETGSLFAEELSEKIVNRSLLPEFKNADFFLKIESDFDQIPMRRNIAMINEIKEVISAYEIDISQIKANNNLIFN